MICDCSDEDLRLKDSKTDLGLRGSWNQATEIWSLFLTQSQRKLLDTLGEQEAGCRP